MTLLEDFQGVTTEFKNRIVAALSKAATDELLTLVDTDPDYKQKAAFCKVCVNATPNGVRGVARAMISQGVTAVSPDSTIQTAITGNFDALSAMYDPTLEA